MHMQYALANKPSHLVLILTNDVNHYFVTRSISISVSSKLYGMPTFRIQNWAIFVKRDKSKSLISTSKSVANKLKVRTTGERAKRKWEKKLFILLTWARSFSILNRTICTMHICIHFVFTGLPHEVHVYANMLSLNKCVECACI